MGYVSKENLKTCGQDRHYGRQLITTNTFNELVKSRENELVYFRYGVHEGYSGNIYKKYWIDVSFVTKSSKDNYNIDVVCEQGLEKLKIPKRDFINENRERILSSFNKGLFKPSLQEANLFWNTKISFDEMLVGFGYNYRTSFNINDIIIKSPEVQIFNAVIDGNVDMNDEQHQRKYFDFIRVEIYVISPHEFQNNKDRFRKLLKELKSDIDRLVLSSISRNTKFKKYGVPINILKCTNCILTHDNRLVYTFELKKELKSET